MKSAILAGAVALALGAPAAAQAPASEAQAAATSPMSPEARRTAEALIAEALDADRAFAIVESLTTEIGPRLAGTAGEARARDWAVDLLTELEFDEVRVEPFIMPGWVRGAERAEIVSPAPQPLHVTALGGSVATPPEGIEADIVRFATFDDLLEAADGAAAGKIVFIDEATVKTQTGAGYGKGVRQRVGGASEAAKRGAVAVVIRSVGTHSHRFPHTGVMRYADGVTQIPAGAISPPDADQLARLLARGGPVRLKLTLTPQAPGEVSSGNVIAELRGRERPDEIVLIGAHLDSWDLATGALDDGAGVAIVTAAAKLIENLPQRPKRTIRVVLFGAEEVGLLGARAYVALHADAMSDHIVGAESDFGAGRIWRLSTRWGDEDRPLADAIARVLSPLGVAYENNEATGGPDIGPLRAQGVPVAELGQDGWDYFDYHHTPDDTLDKIDPKTLRQNVAAYAAFVYLIAESDVDLRLETALSEGAALAKP